MKHIQDIRHSLNIALARLNELELALAHRAPEVHEWDAKTITECVAKEFGISKEILYVRARGRPMVYARQVAMFLMSKHTSMVPREITAHFRPDMHIGTHTYAVKAVSTMMELDPIFSGKVVRAETAYLIAKNAKIANNE